MPSWSYTETQSISSNASSLFICLIIAKRVGMTRGRGRTWRSRYREARVVKSRRSECHDEGTVSVNARTHTHTCKCLVTNDF